MTANQLGECLGYSNGRKGIDNLLSRNEYLKQEDFSFMMLVDTWEGGQNVPTIKQNYQETRVFTEDGIYEIAFLSCTEKAKEFRSWIRKILKSLVVVDLDINEKSHSF